MKILTSKKKKRALQIITELRRAFDSENIKEKINVIELLAELTYILGGLKGLQNELIRIYSDIKDIENEIEIVENGGNG